MIKNYCKYQARTKFLKFLQKIKLNIRNFYLISFFGNFYIAFFKIAI
ncbi:MAG: hypothetical protein IGBAC_0563 [Ignavibacteriae bacterium]|nr:MAG: hypothetical protein IGBAC_0563 [Ignavibacteriota bacterium]